MLGKKGKNMLSFLYEKKSGMIYKTKQFVCVLELSVRKINIYFTYLFYFKKEKKKEEPALWLYIKWPK